jgi:hypothetical protein
MRTFLEFFFPHFLPLISLNTCSSYPSNFLPHTSTVTPTSTQHQQTHHTQTHTLSLAGHKTTFPVAAVALTKVSHTSLDSSQCLIC